MFEGPAAAHVQAEDSSDTPEVAPMSSDQKLADMFPRPKQYTVDSHGVVQTVESTMEAGELHQKEHEDA